MALQYTCDFCGEPIEEDDTFASIDATGDVWDQGGGSSHYIYRAWIGHYHTRPEHDSPSCYRRLGDAMKAAGEAGRAARAVQALEAIPTIGETTPKPAESGASDAGPRPRGRRQPDLELVKSPGERERDEGWEEYRRRQAEWSRKSWDKREALLLDVLGGDSLTVGELASRLNASFGWPTEGRRRLYHDPLSYPPIDTSDARAVAMRLLGRDVLDRVHGPYKHMAAVWHFFRKPVNESSPRGLEAVV